MMSLRLSGIGVAIFSQCHCPYWSKTWWTVWFSSNICKWPWMISSNVFSLGIHRSYQRDISLLELRVYLIPRLHVSHPMARFFQFFLWFRLAFRGVEWLARNSKYLSFQILVHRQFSFVTIRQESFARSALFLFFAVWIPSSPWF